ncbi:MAG: tetratricopeptide repeat protein, partial [Pricia sp.]
MSILRAATRIFCGLGLLVAPLAAAAQSADDEARDYRTYRTTGTEKAPTNKSAEQEAREEAAWHANTLLCERGNLAACYNTARAYELGEGTAQSRPIAAILYTEGCALDYAESCRRLGGLADVEVDDAGKEEAAELFSKACSLGSLRACTSYAYALSSGRGVERDEASAAALLRETCSAGEVEACRMQAAELLKPERGFYDHSEGISLLNFGCDNGYPAACSDLLRLKLDPAVYSVLRPRIETLSLACAAQSGLDCLTLADHAFVGNEMPMDRDYAYRMYELSCALLEQICIKSEAMLAEPELLQKCHDGNEAACGDLGEIYMRQDLILQNQEKGRAYLSQACNAAQGKACYLLALAMIDETYTPSADSGPDAFQYLDLSCNLGHYPACNRLAQELDYG